MRLMTQYIRWVNRVAGGGRAHRVTHKIVKNGQSLKYHHRKRVSPTGIIFNTYSVMNDMFNYEFIKIDIGWSQ